MLNSFVFLLKFMPPLPPPSSTAARPDPALLQKQRVGKNTFVVLLIEIVLVILVLAVPFYFIIRSGVLQIPGFSWLYHAPVPTRVVSVTGTLSSAGFVRLLETKLRNSVALAPSSIDHQVVFRDAELTAAFRGILAEPLRRSGFQAQDLQALVVPGGFELSGKLTRSVLHVDAIVRASLETKGRSVQLVPVSVRLGQLTVPVSTFVWFIRELTGMDASRFDLAFGNLPIESVVAESGQLRLLLHLTQAP